MKKILLIALLAQFTSCAIQNYTSSNGKMLDSQVSVLNTSPISYVVPLTVEVTVTGDKFTDLWTLSKHRAEVEMGGNLDNIRNWALYKSSKLHQSDLIVSPLINVERNSAGDIYTVEVIGFPANYINWRSVQKEDCEWIKLLPSSSSTHSVLVK